MPIITPFYNLDNKKSHKWRLPPCGDFTPGDYTYSAQTLANLFLQIVGWGWGWADAGLGVGGNPILQAGSR